VLLVKQASTILIAPQGVVCDGGMLFLRVGYELRIGGKAADASCQHESRCGFAGQYGAKPTIETKRSGVEMRSF